MERFVEALAGLAVNRPRATIAIIAAVTVFLAALLPRLQTDFRIEDALPESNPERIAYEDVKKTFGRDDSTVLVMIAEEDIFQPEVIRMLAGITDRLETCPEVLRVASLSSIRKAYGNEEELVIRKVVDVLPRTGAECRRLRDEVLGDALLVDQVVSRRGDAALIAADLRPEHCGVKGRVAFLAKLEAILEPYRSEGHTIVITGMPMLRARYMRLVHRDQLLLCPLGFLLTAIFLLVVLPRRRYVALPLLVLLLSSIWTMGLAALLDVPLTFFTAVIPVLLFTYGTSDCIHILVRFEQERSHLPANKAILLAMKEVGLA